MKKYLYIILLLSFIVACHEDEESESPPAATTDTTVLPSLTMVIEGDTIRTDSIYTRIKGNGDYQIVGTDSSGIEVRLTIFDFLAEALYVANWERLPNSLRELNSIQVNNYDGQSYTTLLSAEGGYINITNYSESDGHVSGSFYGSLLDSETEQNVLTIDTAYFNDISPIQFNPESGKADVFFQGKLFRNIDATAALDANHRFSTSTNGNGGISDFHFLLMDAHDPEHSIGHFLFGPACYLEESFDSEPRFTLSIDSAGQTASGVFMHEQFDQVIYLNNVPLELPEFSAGMGQINLFHESEVIPFEIYLIEVDFSVWQNQVVEVKAWSNSGPYFEMEIAHIYDGNLFNCSFGIFVGEMRLYENENDPSPLATFEGTGTLNSLNYEGVDPISGNLGFMSDETQLSGIDLDVIAVE